MGNTPPYVVQLGKFVSINMLEGEANGEHYEKRCASYRVDDRTAEVSIKRTEAANKKANAKFVITITDSEKMNLIGLPLRPYRFEMMVERAEGQHLKVMYAKTCDVYDKDTNWSVVALAKVGVTLPRVNLFEKDATKDRKMITTKDGGIVETSLNPYRVRGRDNHRGLVVIEWRKKVWNQKPYVVTVGHYFASLGETNNMGFSVVARIRGEDGPGALQVEGPEFHPATALFEMFDNVLRSGWWAPNACPHCASNNDAANAIPIARGETTPSVQSQVANPVLQSNGENSKWNQPWFSRLAS